MNRRYIFNIFWVTVALVLALLVQSSCVNKNCNLKQTYDFLERFSMEGEILPISKAVKAAITESPAEENFSHNGEMQRVIIDLEVLKERLALSKYTLAETSPYLVIKYRWRKYRIELRWIGKSCTSEIKEGKMVLSFENAQNPEQQGSYGYSIYDYNNHVWRSYLYYRLRKFPVVEIVLPVEGLSACEDQERLKTYDLPLETPAREGAN